MAAEWVEVGMGGGGGRCHMVLEGNAASLECVRHHGEICLLGAKRPAVHYRHRQGPTTT